MNTATYITNQIAKSERCILAGKARFASLVANAPNAGECGFYSHVEACRAANEMVIGGREEKAYWMRRLQEVAESV